MKDFLINLAEKARQNKDTIIKVGAAVAGAVVTAFVVGLIVNNQNETEEFEGLDIEEDEESGDFESDEE